MIGIEEREVSRSDQAAASIGIQEENAGRLPLDAVNTHQGLAKLVLTLIELIKELVERQALSRMERGTLTDPETEKIGETLFELEAKIDELCALFELKRSDLNIDLGPLGDLL